MTDNEMYLMYDYNKEMWVLCEKYASWANCVFETNTPLLHKARQKAEDYLRNNQINLTFKVV